MKKQQAPPPRQSQAPPMVPPPPVPPPPAFSSYGDNYYDQYDCEENDFECKISNDVQFQLFPCF